MSRRIVLLFVALAGGVLSACRSPGAPAGGVGRAAAGGPAAATSIDPELIDRSVRPCPEGSAMVRPEAARCAVW